MLTYLLTYFNVDPNIFKSDAYTLINLILISISTGYLATRGMKYGSDSSVRIVVNTLFLE